MPSYTGPNPDFRTPFGSNVWLRSTRDVKTKSYTVAAATITSTTIDGFANQRQLQKGMVMATIVSGPNAGKVGPYQPSAGNTTTTPVWTLGTTGVPTGGTFVITLNGYQTAPIAYNASAAVVQAALEALPGVTPGGVDVVATGGALPSAVTLTFQAAGHFGGTNPVPVIAVAVNSLTGGTAPAVTLVLTDPTAIQTITTTGTPTGGTFELEFAGYVTTALPYNASAAVVQAALEALPPLANDPSGSALVCTGGPLPTGVAVTFQAAGRYGQLAVPVITPVNNLLTGGATPAVSVAQTQAGGALAGATDGRGAAINIVGINNTFLAWQLEYHDDQIAVAYEASAVEAWCFMYDPNGNPIPLDNAGATAAAFRSKSVHILFS